MSVADGITLDPAPQASIVFDRNDRPVFTFFRERRTDVPLDRVSPHMIDAVLAIEDRRFYTHNGVDFFRVFGAAWADVRARRVVEGGSSITQQLVRLDTLTRERTLQRKVREMLMAIAIEQRFDKSQILEAYLNRVYFGDGYYGIESAARGYFATSAARSDAPRSRHAGRDHQVAGELRVAGSARAGGRAAESRSPRHARQRLDLGAETRELENAELSTVPPDHDELGDAEHVSDDAGYCGLYFKEEIRRLLLKRFGADQLYQGGLRIYATLAPELQRAAEQTVADRLRALESNKAYQRRGHDEPLEASLVALDPMTGYVLALVGGRDFHESRFNRATQARRRPGSAFKPLLFAAAIEQATRPAR